MRLGRRAFSRSLLLGLAALVGGAPGRWLVARAEAEASPPSPPSLFSAVERRVLALFADAILPAWHDEPAASAGDFLARFEAFARSAPERSDAYGRWFERFVNAVDARVPLLPGPADPVALAALFAGWQQEWRSEARPSFGAQFFEMLRRDVLRTYYASPAGWKAVGYAGPVHRATPDGSVP
jgi:hypothetical protein